MSRLIKQIIPVNGDWRAVLEAEGQVFIQPIGCWALLEEEGIQTVLGMVHGDISLVPCLDTSVITVLSYLGPGETLTADDVTGASSD